jgi:hypothetical protein
MAEDAGTVYASIKLELNELENDIHAVKMLFADMSSQVARQTLQTTKKTNTHFENIRKNGINQFAKLATGINAAFMSLPIIGFATMVIAGIKKVVSGIADFVNETAKAYITHQQELAKMEQVLKSTGAAAWTSAKQLEGQAKQLAQTTTKTVNEIMQMQSVLLGFKSITGDAFERTTKAILDMTTVMGGDLVSAANTVGKAIDSPVQGMSALSRHGFVFTKQQKELIRTLEESGQHFEAQKIILEEVEKPYRDTAAAIAEVTKNQARLDYQTNRLKQAQGESTSKMKEWWAGVRADFVETRAEALELYNAIKKAYEYDPKKGAEAVKEAQERALEEFETESERIVAIRTAELTALEEAFKLASSASLIAQDRLNTVLSKNTERMATWTGNALLDMVNMYVNNPIIELKNLLINTMEFGLESAFSGEASELWKQFQEREEANLAYWQAEKEAAEAAMKAHQEETAAIYDKRQLLDADIEQIENQRTALEAIQQTRKDTLEQIKRINDEEGTGLINAEEAQQRRMAAYQTETNSINELITAVGKLKWSSTESINQQIELMDSLETALAIATNRYKELYKQMDNPQMSEKEFLDERQRILELYERKVNHLNQMRDARQITDENYEKEILSLQQQRINSLDELIERAGETAKTAPITFQMVSDFQEELNAQEIRANFYREERKLIELANDARDKAVQLGMSDYEISKMNLEAERERVNAMITAGEISRQVGEDYIASIERLNSAQQKFSENEFFKTTVQDLVDEYTRLTGSVEEVREMEERRAWEAITSQKEYQNLLAQANEGNELARDKIENIRYEFEKLWNYAETRTDWQKFWDKACEATKKYGSQVQGIISSGLQLYVDGVKRETDALKKELDKRHKMLTEVLEKEKQERLYAKGFAEAATEEQHQRELELARESGDQQRVYAAHDAYEKWMIEEEFAQKQKALDEEIARQKAELGYKAATAQWKMALMNATVSAAQAVLQAAINNWPVPAVPMMAMAGALGAAQVAVVSANKPKMEMYKDGGIVPGNSFRGDNIKAMVNSGEMILNKRQQKNMFNAIDNNEIGGGGEQPITIPITINLDGKPIAKFTIDAVNRRQYFIDAGSIIK